MSANMPICSRPLVDVFLWILVIVGIALTIAVYLYCPVLLIYVLIVGVILLIGFGIPKCVEHKAAMQRAEQAKMREIQKWGFQSRDRDAPWINYIDYPLVKKTAIAQGKRFYSEWLVVHEGEIIVNPGKSTVPSQSPANGPLRIRRKQHICLGWVLPQGMVFVDRLVWRAGLEASSIGNPGVKT